MKRKNSASEGIRLYRSKRYEAALKEFLGLQSDENRDFPELSYYLGLCYTQLGKYEEALLYLEQVVASESGLIHLYQGRMVLGFIYAVTKRYRLAEFEFRKLLDDGFESAKVHSALAYALFVQRKPEDSIRSLEKALELEPDNANAMNSMGYILAEQNKRLGTALACCQKAVTKSPKNAAYLDSLGWVHYKIGNKKEARQYLRQSLELSPKNKEILDHLKTVMKEDE